MKKMIKFNDLREMLTLEIIIEEIKNLEINEKKIIIKEEKKEIAKEDKKDGENKIQNLEEQKIIRNEENKNISKSAIIPEIRKEQEQYYPIKVTNCSASHDPGYFLQLLNENGIQEYCLSSMVSQFNLNDLFIRIWLYSKEEMNQAINIVFLNLLYTK